MKGITSGLLILGLSGFFIIGGFLFTGHSGIAIRASNYIYVILLIAVIFKTFKNA